MPKATDLPRNKIAVAHRYPELFNYDPKLDEIQLTRIYEQLPEGTPLLQGSVRREVEILGITLWGSFMDCVGNEKYSIARPLSNHKVLWHIHWTRWSGHPPTLITNDYPAYLRDLTILRMLA